MSGFRVALKTVSDRLGSDDIETLKYMCEDDVPRSELEKVKSGISLFAALQRRNKISETDTSFLQHLLHSVGKDHLMKYITDPGFGHGVPHSGQPKPKAGISPPVGVGALAPNVEMEYRKMLASVANDLTNYNFNEMLYISADYFRGVQPRANKPLDFFTILEQRALLSPTNLSTLQALLSEIGRNDLIEKLREFVAITHPPARFTAGHTVNPLQESYMMLSPSAPPTYAPQDPVANERRKGPFDLESHLPPNRAASGFMDAPRGPHDALPYPQPQSREPVIPPRNEHQSTGYQQMGQPEDETRAGELALRAKNEPSANRLPSINMDCREQGAYSSSGDTTPHYPQQESAVNAYVEQSAYRSTAPLPAAYIQMERQAPQDPRMQEYRQKDIQEEMLMEERAKEAKKAQEDAERVKKELQYKHRIQQLEQEKERLMQQVQQEQRRSHRQLAVPADLCYPMKAKPHGLCVIFNNDTFYATSAQDELPERKGSDVDQHNLNIIFSRLNYQVRSYKNQNANQMLETMKAVSNLDHSSCDSLVCCLLTHGKKDGVFGSDGTLLTVSDMASLVKASYCRTLKGKPKMFFVQACRGDDEDKGVQLQSDDGEQSVVRQSLPNDADFLFAYSTAPGTVSWRSPQYGSWYVSKLCETLDQHAHTGMDLVSMLTIVNDKVSEAYTKQGFKQCPAPVNMLRKKVIFC